MNLQKKVEIYLEKKRCTRDIDVVQYDTGIQLVFALMDFIAPDGTTATLYVQKPSGNFVYQEDDITVSGDTITIDLHNQALTEFGNVLYQVQMKNGADVISTFAGTMHAQKSLANAAAVESKTVISSFNTMTAEKIAEIQAATQTQIASIQAESLKQQENVAGKGATTLATIPDDYTATYNMAAEALRTKAPVIVQSASGSSIHVTDSAEMPLQSLKIEGEEAQKQYTGKNELNNTATTQTVKGVAFTVNANKSIAVKGTATGNIDILIGSIANLASGEKYIASGISGGTTTTYNVIVQKILNGAWVTNTWIYNGETAYTVDSTYNTLSYRLIVASGATVDTTFYPMVRKASVTDPTYEPYTNGASPNPDYPQAIYNSGDCVEMRQGVYQTNSGALTTSGITTYLCNKYPIPCKSGDTLAIDVELATIKGVHFLFYNDSGYISYSTIFTTSGTMTVPSGTTFFNFDICGVDGEEITTETVGKVELTINNKYVLQIKSCNKNELNFPHKDGWSHTYNGITYTYNQGIITANGTATENSYLNVTFTNEYEENESYILSGCPSGGSGYQLQANYLGATGGELGAVDKGEGKIFTPLRKSRIILYVWVTKDTTVNNVVFKPMLRKAIFTDDTFEPHKESISTLLLDEPPRAIGEVKDVIEYIDNGYKVRRKIKEIVYDGSSDELIYLQSINDSDIANFGFNLSAWSVNQTKTMCNRFKHQYSLIADTTTEGIYNALNVIFVRIKKERASTVDEFRAWLAENPITVQYELAEEVIEDISDQTPFYEMQTFDGVTTISTTDRLQPTLEVEYATDTKRYIDNKFAELQTALANAVL